MAGNGKILLTAEDGSEEIFFVLEEAELAGASYLLVARDSGDEDTEALILRKNTVGENEDDDMVAYEIVEDEEELKIISKYLEEVLEDVDIILE